MRPTTIFIVIIFMGMVANAQNHDLDLARRYVAMGQPDSAISIYEEVYLLTPDAVYTDYINALILAKKYKDAEKVVQDRVSTNPDVALKIDLGKIYLLDGKDKKANEIFDGVVGQLNGDDIFTQRVGKLFSDAHQYEYGIKTYERASQIFNNHYIYAIPLSDLYNKIGKTAEAIELLLSGMPMLNMSVENVKTTMLTMLGDDSGKLRVAQKVVLAKMNEHPENIAYAELMTWIYTQKNDWDGALLQIEALDELNKDDCRRLLNFAHTASNAGQYEIADKAYDDIIAKGNTRPFYMIAKSDKLNNGLTKLKKEIVPGNDEVNNLVHLYDSTLHEFPSLYATQTAGDAAMLSAQYAGNPAKGIEVLERALGRPEIKRALAGDLKLQMGDYYLLEGKTWDASLIYSQVDKDFKQDAMGEDARFRNAKLAYYRGDFTMAQQQLRVLKSATTELIANDALYLSVLITENTKDSDNSPLERFAHADLLLQQNKDKEAEALLDSLNKTYPKHSLNDDILMLRAIIAEKHRDHQQALLYLHEICAQYGEDVLGDDAVFKIAEIYHDQLHNNDSAKHYYEQLIIDYPGSTFVQTARQKLNDLTNRNDP